MGGQSAQELPEDNLEEPARDIAGDPSSAELQSTDNTLERTVDLSESRRPVPGFVAFEPRQPQAFGRYEVRGVIGEGGFGTVYRGYDLQLDRFVAIKVPQLKGASVDVEKEFLREARQLAQLNHPGIVSVYDIGVQDGQCYIVTDFLQGLSLGAWLQRNQPTWRQSVQIVADLADSLAHAHQHSIVHRDIKPDNIILSKELKPVLVDFGLALSDPEMAKAERGLISGTPNYMSPEQARGEGNRIDGRTDIYAAGVILYRMLCGRLPFHASTVPELLRQVRDDSPQPLRQLVNTVSVEVERICLKAMAKREHDRYRTAADMAAELRQVLVQYDESNRLSANLPTATSASAVLSPASVESTTIRRARDAERRQVTVLYCQCDLFDMVEFLENLDPETQHEVLLDYQRICESAVSQFHGTIVQSTGTGLLVCFGYPVAFEDAPLRAVRTGLSLLEKTAHLNARLRQQQVNLSVQIGIHTGQVIVSDAIAGGTLEPMSLVGEARNVATRLESVTSPNTVAVSSATYRLTQGFFVCEKLGRHSLKGAAQPIEVYRVLGESAARNRIDAGESAGLTPLVGREQEVGLLQQRWEEAAEGMGHVVLMMGDAGLGKSRLVHVLKQHAAAGDQNSSIIEWWCSPYHQNSALHPVADFFQRMMRQANNHAAANRLARLARYLEPFQLGAPDEVVPLFADLLEIPLNGDYPPLALNPMRHKERTFDLLLAWLRRLADRRPVLFVVEDLHWIDASTLELLGLIVEQAGAENLLMVLTFRPEFEVPWNSHSHQSQMALSRLRKKQVREMMEQKTGAHDLPDELVDRVVQRTDGVPLFVEEFTRMIQDSGALVAENGRIRLAESFDLQQIPATLQDLLMARLDRIDCIRDVSQMGATLGREFSYQLLLATVKLDESTLGNELTKLVDAEVLFQKGRPPESTYTFKHALIQDAAYQSLIKKRRQQFHKIAADTLESNFPGTIESQPELLAHHFTESGNVRKGLEYWSKAGRRAQQRYANTEAIHHFRRGLEIVGSSDESHQRDADELHFQVPLATTLLAAKGYAHPDAGTTLERARELCVRLDDEDSLFFVTWGIWTRHLLRDELDVCLQLGDELMQLADQRGDPGLLMEAHYAPGCTMVHRGDFSAARQHLESMFPYFDASRCREYARRTGQNSGVCHQIYLSVAMWALGYPDRARRLVEASGEMARGLSDPFSHVHALNHGAWVYHFCRDGKNTLRLSQQTIDISAEHAFVFWQACGTVARGASYVLQGKYADAITEVKRGMDAFRATGAKLHVCYGFSILAEALWQAGRLDEALEAVASGLDASARFNERYVDAELLRLRGEILLARAGEGDVAAAEIGFRQALDVARLQQAKSWELRATMSLARLLQRLNRSSEGQNALTKVYSWFREGFDTADLVEARKLLAELARD